MEALHKPQIIHMESKYSGSVEPNIQTFAMRNHTRYQVVITRGRTVIRKSFTCLDEARAFRDRVLLEAGKSQRGGPAKRQRISVSSRWGKNPTDSPQHHLEAAITRMIPASHDPREYIINDKRAEPNGALDFAVRAYIQAVAGNYHRV
jgi:hypothetical protein